uniref:Uncharacterized protein LOC105109560 n=1 Tax=Rhizophora mucronata TaxID=61149 RepID=A0A2P2K9W1_RHIMU
MDRNGRLVGIILAILIFANVSDASFLSKLRQLAALNSARNSDVVSVPPSPSPDSLRSDSSSKNPKVPVPVPENKTSNNTVKQAPPPLSQKDDGKNGEADKKKKNKNKDQDLQPEVSKNCTGVPRRCVQKSWIACILNFETGSKELVILVENEGEGPLRVYLSAPNASDNPLVELPKKKSETV